MVAVLFEAEWHRKIAGTPLGNTSLSSPFLCSKLKQRWIIISQIFWFEMLKYTSDIASLRILHEITGCEKSPPLSFSPIKLFVSQMQKQQIFFLFKHQGNFNSKCIFWLIWMCDVVCLVSEITRGAEQLWEGAYFSGKTHHEAFYPTKGQERGELLVS